MYRAYLIMESCPALLLNVVIPEPGVVTPLNPAAVPDDGWKV